MFLDQETIVQVRQGLSRIISFMKANPDLFPQKPPEEVRLLNEADRITINQVWHGFLDYMVVLNCLGRRYATVKNGTENDVFDTTYAIFLARYRFALAFIQKAEKSVALHVLLNEPIPEMGLPEGTYASLKSEFLNPLKASNFVLMDTRYRQAGKSLSSVLVQGIVEDRAFIWQTVQRKGPELTTKNALQHMKYFGQKAWLPVQTLVAEWMGDTKVWRADKSLMTEAQIAAMKPLLKPGDVLLARSEWYLSNMGLPGFWTHALLYVGTPSDRRRYFRRDRDVGVWTRKQGIYNGDFEQLLRFYARDAYEESQHGNGEVAQLSVIESKSEGVVLSSLFEAASADSLVVLRPQLPKISKARAILRAFTYVGRPYDFNFDFLTDSEMVCTEVVYKAYEPGVSIRGLHLPLMDVLGRKLMTANDLAKVFDQEYGSQNRQLEMILFLDGNEQAQMAYLSDVERFRKSWKRPKWHIVFPR